MFKKIITIVVPIIAVIAAIFVFGLKVYEDSFDKFQYDGYVIGNVEGKENTKYYFTKDNKYKVNTAKNEVEFSNTEDQNVVVPDASFVHYADGSISTFKKAVALNLDNVKTDTIQFYNVYNGSVFTKTSNGHQIKNVDNKIEFKNFIVKVSDTKYMVVGDKLTIKYGAEEKVIKNGYLEINYLDGNIVRVDNQEFTLQNISSNFHIESSEIKVDLLDKKIIYKDETKLNFGEMTIDSDDNIEIIPDDENTKIDEEASNKVEDFQNQPVVSPGVDMGGMESGIVDTTIKKPEEIVEDNAKIEDPEFTVQSLNVFANKVEAIIDYKDKENILKSGGVWKVVENSTNQIMGMGTVTETETVFEVVCGGLAPGTNYSIIVRAPYEKNGISYEKDFVQKTFITDSTGITIEKNFVTSSTVSYKVTVNEHSKVTYYEYRLVDENNQDVYGTSGEVTNEDLLKSREKIFEFGSNAGIQSNSKYSLVISKVVSGGEEVVGYETYKILKTLKQKPTYKSTSIQTNKLGSSFEIYLNNVYDPDNAVLNYRAEVYTKSDQNPDQNKLVLKREANASAELKINVDDEIITRYTNYTAKLYLTYYDNEKEYDVYIGYHDMIMTSKIGPQVSIELTNVKHDRLEATFTIKDPKETIVYGKETPITVILKNSNIPYEKPLTKTILTTDEFAKDNMQINVEFDDLKKNETYMFVIIATVDLGDENGPREMEIGQFIVTTPNTRPLDVVFDGTQQSAHSTEAFYITMKLSPPEGATYTDGDYEIKTMEKLVLRLRADDYDSTYESCEAENKCWTVELADTIKGGDNSDFVDLLYDEHTYDKNVPDENKKIGIVLTGKTFGAERTYLTRDRKFIIEIIHSEDYTQFKNDYLFEKNYIDFQVNPSKDNMIAESKLDENAIYNENASQYNYSGMIDDIKRETFYHEELKNDTIVGYKITPAIHYDLDCVTMTGWYIYDLRKDYTLEGNVPYEVPESSIQTRDNTVIFMFDKINYDAKEKGYDFEFKRGIPYGIAYSFEVKDVDPDDPTKIFEAKITKEQTMKVLDVQPKKQIPTVDLYLYKTIQDQKDNKYIFKKIYNDPDMAAIDYEEEYGRTLKYKTKGIQSSWQPVYCNDELTESETQKNCIDNSEIWLTLSGDNTLDIKLEYQSLVGVRGSVETQDGTQLEYNVTEEKGEITIIDSMPLYGPDTFPSDEIPKYDIDTSMNDITYNFYADEYGFLSSNVAKVKLTLTAYKQNSDNYVNHVVLYKDFDTKNYGMGGQIPTITVNYSEIVSLRGIYDIYTKVELLYDTNAYGFNTESGENGQVIQLNNNGELSYEKFELNNNVVHVENFDYNTGKLSVKDFSKKDLSSEPTIDIQLHKDTDTGGLYYEDKYNIKSAVNVKKLSSMEINCSGDECKFSFAEVQPTFELSADEIEKSIGLLKYTPTIYVDTDTIKNFVLRRYYYDTEIVDGTAVCTETELGVDDYKLYEQAKAEPEIEDSDLAFNKTYCIKFKYYDETEEKLIDNSTGKETTTSSTDPNGKGYELKDLFYGKNYHDNPNSELTRAYFAKTKSTPEFANKSIKYDNGTIQIDSEEYEKAPSANRQDPNYNRSLTVKFSVDTLKIYNGFEFQIWTDNQNKDGITVWDAGEDEGDQLYPIDDIVIDSEKTNFELKINLDKIAGYKKILADTTYYLVIYPYKSCNYNADDNKIYGDNRKEYSCNEDGKILLDPEIEKFDFDISNPTIIIQRRTPSDADTDRLFGLRITIDDQHRAVGEYSEKEGSQPAKYNIYVLSEINGKEQIGSYEIEHAYTFLEIDNIDNCSGVSNETCQVIVEYQTDLTNEENPDKDDRKETKEIDLSRVTDMGSGNASIDIVNSKLKLTFRGAFNVIAVNRIDYNLSPFGGGQAIKDNYSVSYWTTESEELIVKVEIPIKNIVAGKDYDLNLSFYHEDEKGKIKVANDMTIGSISS